MRVCVLENGRDGVNFVDEVQFVESLCFVEEFVVKCNLLVPMVKLVAIYQMLLLTSHSNCSCQLCVQVSAPSALVSRLFHLSLSL